MDTKLRQNSETIVKSVQSRIKMDLDSILRSIMQEPKIGIAKRTKRQPDMKRRITHRLMVHLTTRWRRERVRVWLLLKSSQRCRAQLHNTSAGMPSCGLGIKENRIYLYGNKFTVITDHQSLVLLKKLTDPNTRLLRWMIFLQEYDFDVVYRKGRNQANVDAKSLCFKR